MQGPVLVLSMGLCTGHWRSHRQGGFPTVLPVEAGVGDWGPGE